MKYESIGNLEHINREKKAKIIYFKSEIKNLNE